MCRFVFRLVAAAVGLAQVAPALAFSLLPPVITGQPHDRTVNPGYVVSLKVDANGTPPLTYQWRKDGLATAGWSNVLTLSPTNLTTGLYDVIVSNAFGSVTSSPARVTLETLAPGINTEPQSQVACSGSTVTFSANPGGAETLSRQWLWNGTILNGATSNVLVLTNLTAAKAGDYALVVTNFYGALTSAVATLTVDPAPPVITQQPQGKLAPDGAAVTLNVQAAACSPLRYQWRSNRVDLAGATNALLILPANSADRSADYQVVVSAASGSVTSQLAIVVAFSPPPVLTCQPQSQMVNAGSSVAFAVCVSSPSPYTVQWLHDGSLVLGTVSNTLVVANLWTNDAGSYWCVVTNRGGAVTSSVATLTVLTSAPVIDGQPESQTVWWGNTILLRSDVLAAPPALFQWRHNGQDVPGATNDDLVFPCQSTTDAGDYVLVASNYFGVVTSAVATVTVLVSPPVINQQPLSRSVEFGSMAGFSVTYSGAPAPQLQWQFNNQDLPGATSSTLSFTVGSTNQAGAYRVILSNYLGVVTSLVATLTVLVHPPVITQQPASHSVEAGSTVYFVVGVTGSPPILYQWQFNGQNIGGATAQNLYRYSVTPSQSGDYQVVVSNYFGVVTSVVARLTVVVHPPVITLDPQSQSVDLGTAVSFYANASGTGPFTYRWQHNGQAIAGNASSLYLANVSTNEAGDYQVVVSNFGGAATSTVARLTVLLRPPQITTQPQGQTLDAGSMSYFSVTAIGALPMAFQWQFNGQNIAGATASQLYHNDVTTNDMGDYWVVASNAFGFATSQVARLTVLVHPPAISQQPLDQTVDVGDTAYFEVVLSAGTQPLFFCWRHEGRDVPGATNSQLYLSSLTRQDAGGYQVVVSNCAGMVTSEVATLTVAFRPPSITSQPDSQTADAGTDVTFSVSADGAPMPSFQWQFGGQDIPGGVGPGLTLTNVTWRDAGDYRVRAYNDLGAVTSVIASLTVMYRPPGFDVQPYGQSVWAGSYAYFGCSAFGGPAPALQWLCNGQPLAGATGRYLQFLVSSTNQAGDYSVIASNAFGAVTSAVARLTVLISPPTFSAQPMSRGVVAGDSVQLIAAASGQPPPSFQWRFNGQDIPMATNSALTIANATINGAGGYLVVASSEGGSITSRVATLVVSPPGPLDRWEWKNPLPQGNDLYCAAYGNGLFVALGRDGAHVRSTDGGVTWQSHSQGEDDLRGVAYGNGLFVAIGNGLVDSYYVPRLQTSADGIHWASPESAFSSYDQPAGVAFGNGRFVVVTLSGTALVSSNGLHWTVVENAAPFGFLKVAFGNGQFLALVNAEDNGAGPTGRIAVSTDGLTWTNRSMGTPGAPRDIAFGNGLFVVLAGQDNSWASDSIALASSDGLNWTAYPISSSHRLTSIAAGSGRLVAVQESADYPAVETVSAASSDGVNWTVQSTGLGSELYGVAGGAGRFLAVGDKGVIVTSVNGQSWNVRSPGSPTNLRGAARGAGLSVITGNDGLLFTSPDSATWTRRVIPNANNLRSVAYGNGRFVGVGEIETNYAIVLVSADGANWMQTEATLAYGLYSVAYGKGLFVAVGWNGGIVTSPDGFTWTYQYSGTTARFNAITFNGELFIAVGKKGVTATSSDGMVWTVHKTPLNNFLQGVAYGNGRFVAAGEAGTLCTSTNAVNWSAQSGIDSPLGWTDIEDVQFANGLFLAVGDSGFLATSPDGVIWTQHRTGCQNPLRSVLYADGYVTAVGNNETLLQSDFFGPPILRVRGPLGREGFEFSVDGEVGCACRLQASDDMVHWEDVFTFTNTRVTTLFLDTDVDFRPHRFYRIVSP
jgi:hypothetical protein